MNIIPIIAKADTISKSELQVFKEKVYILFYIKGKNIFRFLVVLFVRDSSQTFEKQNGNFGQLTVMKFKVPMKRKLSLS